MPSFTSFKDKPFATRLGHAWAGICVAVRGEASFRTQLLAAALVVLFMLVRRPPLLWCALLLVLIGLVLAAELFNTALEHMLDALHPETAPWVKIAKDCAAGAVLVLSIVALAVFGLMLASFGTF